MFNTTIIKFPAYTNREFVNFGLHKANELYDYKFTPNDRGLLNSGAISLIPFEMCDFIVEHDTVLGNEKRHAGDKIDYKIFDENTLFTLIRTCVIKCTLKKEFNNKEKTIKTAKLYSAVGKTFKELSEELDIDFDVIKEEFGLKQNASKKKVTEKDIEKISELLK